MGSSHKYLFIHDEQHIQELKAHVPKRSRHTPIERQTHNSCSLGIYGAAIVLTRGVVILGWANQSLCCQTLYRFVTCFKYLFHDQASETVSNEDNRPVLCLSATLHRLENGQTNCNASTNAHKSTQQIFRVPKNTSMANSLGGIEYVWIITPCDDANRLINLTEFIFEEVTRPANFVCIVSCLTLMLDILRKVNTFRPSSFSIAPETMDKHHTIARFSFALGCLEAARLTPLCLLGRLRYHREL